MCAAMLRYQNNETWRTTMISSVTSRTLFTVHASKIHEKLRNVFYFQQKIEQTWDFWTTYLASSANSIQSGELKTSVTASQYIAI